MAEEVLTSDSLNVVLAGRKVLKDVTFSLSRGAHLVLVGPNGAGKSTLLKTIARIHTYQSGSIRLNGAELNSVSRLESARQVAYVPQVLHGIPHYTVEEFLFLARYPFQSPFSGVCEADWEAVEGALQRTGLSSLRKRILAELSGGEAQRVLVASVLAQKAEIVLLDEPLTFLDPAQQAAVRELIRELLKINRLTVLSVSHDVNFALSLASQVIGLRDGQVVFSGTPMEFADAHNLRRIYGCAFTVIPRSASAIPFVSPI